MVQIFFFQAEDGIRDVAVTGVQTCALPIFMKQFYPAGDPNDSLNVIGYSQAQTLVQVLRQAGDELTRANIMKQAASLKMDLPMLYPGISLQTGGEDFFPIKKMQLVRFDGSRYAPVQ